MSHPLRSVRDVIGLGLVWAFGWALVGALIEAAHDTLPGGLPIGTLVDIWVPTLAVPGLIAGVIAAVAIQISGARAVLDLVAIPRTSLWGAAAGLLGGVVLLAVVSAGTALHPLWLWAVTIVAVAVLLGVVSGLATVLWFRWEAPERFPAG